MSKPYVALAAHSQWLADNADDIELFSNQPLNDYLLDKGSLTTALMTLSNNQFHVELLRQEVMVPHAHELAKLDNDLATECVVREVELHIHNTAVVFARSIIPIQLYEQTDNGLKELGIQPLGQLLFKDGNIRISKREFAQIEILGDCIFARRTPYDYKDNKILVSEFFLPEFAQYLCN